MMKTFFRKWRNKEVDEIAETSKPDAQPDYYLLMPNTKENKKLENKIVKVLLDDCVEGDTSYFLVNDHKLIMPKSSEEAIQGHNNSDLYDLANERTDLTEWEQEFLTSITCSVSFLTAKQQEKLNEIATRGGK
jgi:hypothetical protein